MFRYRKMKSTIATLIAAAMLLTCNTSVVCADEVSANGAKTPEGTEVTAMEETTPTVDILKDGPNYDIEINQGFSFHVDRDVLKKEVSGGYSYLKNFIAGKETVLMVTGLQAKTKEEAETEAKNLSVVCKTKEGEEKNTWNSFEIVQDYDENSNKKGFVAIVKLDEGIEKGNYTFVVKNGDQESGKREDVDFYNAKPLNILAVPVTAYYSDSANVEGGGCPADKINQGVPCDEALWNKVKEGEDSIERYLLDVYPVSKINVEFGNTFDGGSAEYNMCNDDGQKKLWEDVSKLQVRDKETGKDKYDIILAFVMYRQDKTGTGQGYIFGRPTNIITLTDKDMLPTVAHEIAHCYGVGDEYDGGSYNYRVNNVPLEYNSKGRDKITSESVTNTTDYTKKGVEKYKDVDPAQNDYYWLSSSQYKAKLGDVNVCDGKKKDKINESGNGSVIDPTLHPFILSKKEFVHFAENDKEICPTISYMGSGYSGNQNFYFTTSVIWDHLFNEFMEKEKKSESSSILATEEEEGLEPYYDDEVRFGESRLVEVAGEMKYTEKSDKATVSGCEVDPMFSYKGDLEYIDYLDLGDDGDEKDIPNKNRFVFAALDGDGKVITSPVDGKKSIVEFTASNINTAVNVSGNEANDKRIQDFCEFEFEAEYPEGTKAFAIMNADDYDENTSYKADDKKVKWFKEVPPQEIDGRITAVTNTKEEMKVQWECAAFDKDDKATTDNLYTMVYYAPKGDEGEVYFMEDGFYEAKDNEPGMFDFKVSENGIATYSFKPTDYFKEDEITDKAYVWVKISDGVNGLDLYSDEDYRTDSEKMDDIVIKEKDSDEKTQVLGDTLKLKKDGKKFVISGLKDATGTQKLTVNAGAKIYAEELKGLDVSKVTISFNGTAGTAKDVKKHFKLNKKGQMTLKVYKNDPSYTLTIPVTDKCTLVLTVTNVGFDKALKKKSISTKTGEGSTISVNLIELKNKEATENPSKFLSADWTVDKKEIKAGGSDTSKSKLAIELSKDNRTLTIKNPGDVTKGKVKIEAVINGKKYKTAIKVKVK